jgi:hypothetical protein
VKSEKSDSRDVDVGTDSGQPETFRAQCETPTRVDETRDEAAVKRSEPISLMLFHFHLCRDFPR